MQRYQKQRYLEDLTNQGNMDSASHSVLWTLIIAWILWYLIICIVISSKVYLNWRRRSLSRKLVAVFSPDSFVINERRNNMQSQLQKNANCSNVNYVRLSPIQRAINRSLNYNSQDLSIINGRTSPNSANNANANNTLYQVGPQSEEVHYLVPTPSSNDVSSRPIPRYGSSIWRC